jgi:hypothetical protein
VTARSRLKPEARKMTFARGTAPGIGTSTGCAM